MPDPIDTNPTAADPADQSVPAASDRDETAPATPRAGWLAGPAFGPPAAPDEVGTLGPYRIVRQLGAGGMGTVYLAVDTRLNRKIALKVMLPEFAADTAAKMRFLREAVAAGNIAHDNIVTVHEADERDGVPYIVMPLLQGYPLDEYLKTKGAPPLPHVIRIGRETALGLAAAHALGLVHRDIKPANLWLEAPNGRVKVLDFGLAKPVGTETELTKSGAVVGTPAYMSPEQARGEKVDHRTDLFSLGGVLYRLCTGKTPFAGPNVMAVLMALGHDDPTPVRELNPNVPEPLAQLIHQLLAKKPEQRPQTANEVAKRLLAILNQLLTPPPTAAVSSGSVPAVSAADLSTSQPVVVHPVPHQPPIVVPMHVTAAPEDVFANLDESHTASATAAASAPAAPKPERKKGGKGLLIAAGVAVLLAGVAVAVVVSQMGNKGEPAAAPGVPAPPKDGGQPPATFTNSIGMEFVRVPKGAGWLGGAGGKPGETKVEIKADFYLGKYEVTQGEWEAVVGSNPSAFKRGNELVKDISDAELKRFPVEQVSWDDCQLFIERLNTRDKESGWVYRLPTEAEWEYACRGGPVDRSESAFDYYLDKSRNAILPHQASFDPGEGKGLGRSCKVGSYVPNSLGLYDTHGNVWEWCADVATGGDGASFRGQRGGGWSHDSGFCRAASHAENFHWFRFHGLGLRLARVPAGTSVADPDRAAAEWVIGLGGSIFAVGDPRERKTVADLPKARFTLNLVNLNGTKVTDEALAKLKECRSLHSLHLHDTSAGDAGLAHLKALESLRQLGLNGTQVTDAGLAHVTTVTWLEANARVTGTGLAHLKSLDTLYLRGPQVTDASLEGIKELKGLEFVNLEGAKVGDAGLAHFKELRRLKNLQLNGTAVTGAGFVHLKGMTELVSLAARDSAVSDTGLMHLKELKALTYLDVRRTKVTAKGVEMLHAALPGCKIEHDGGVNEPKK